jgi:cytochrome c5
MKAILRTKGLLLTLLCCFAIVSLVFAGEPPAGKNASASSVVRMSDPDSMRIEGEKRFQANCGRCHAAPQKFPPRMMATVLRHMRVRALITDEDRRLVLFYITQ